MHTPAVAGCGCEDVTTVHLQSMLPPRMLPAPHARPTNRVETVGDCYVVAGGLIATDEEGFAVVTKDGASRPGHAEAVFLFAQAMLEEAGQVVMPHNHEAVKVRIGIHSGPITSGVVGHRMPKVRRWAWRVLCNTHEC